MSSQTKIIAVIGGVLIVGALAFKFLVADKPAAPQTSQQRGFEPH